MKLINLTNYNNYDYMDIINNGTTDGSGGGHHLHPNTRENLINSLMKSLIESTTTATMVMNHYTDGNDFGSSGQNHGDHRPLGGYDDHHQLPRVNGDLNNDLNDLMNHSAAAIINVTTPTSNNDDDYINSLNNDNELLIYVILVSIILTIITLSTIIGNVFVIAAIILERNLRTTANYLVLSLAVADLMVACFVMPLGAFTEINQQWLLGTLLCDIWTSSDVLCCTASILHLLAIALDRYWAVTYVDYIHKRTPKRICLMIFTVWIVAAIVSIPPILGWKDPLYNFRIEHEKRCLISQDIVYQVFATISTFYGPLIFILLLYWKIFQVARKRIRHKPGKTIVPASSNLNPKMMINSNNNNDFEKSDDIDSSNTNNNPEDTDNSRMINVTTTTTTATSPTTITTIESADVETKSSKSFKNKLYSSIYRKFKVPASSTSSSATSGTTSVSTITPATMTSVTLPTSTSVSVAQTTSGQAPSKSPRNNDDGQCQPKMVNDNQLNDHIQRKLSSKTSPPSSTSSTLESKSSKSSSTSSMNDNTMILNHSINYHYDDNNVDNDNKVPLMNNDNKSSLPMINHDNERINSLSMNIDICDSHNGNGNNGHNNDNENNEHEQHQDQRRQHEHQSNRVQSIELIMKQMIINGGNGDGSENVRNQNGDNDDDGNKNGNDGDNCTAKTTASAMKSSIMTTTNTVIINNGNKDDNRQLSSPTPPPPSSLPPPTSSLSSLTMNNNHHNNHHQQRPQQQQQHQLLLRNKIINKESIESKRERKAAKILAIITGIFVICWLPFFVMALIMPLCKDCQPNKHIFSIFLWLGYCNSLLNPIIYTIFSPDFRNGFRRILCGKKRPQPLQ